MKTSGKLCLLFCSVILLASLAAAQVAAPEDAKPARVGYTIELKDPAQHLIHVHVRLPAGASQRELQLPVWNATYIVRDFAQYVNHVTAHDAQDHALPVRALTTSRWRISGAERGAVFEYDETLDMAGPFGAQFNEHHAFLNLAMVLVYDVNDRSASVRLSIQPPAGWRCAGIGTGIGVNFMEFIGPATLCGVTGATYDRLVDSPIELGKFQKVDFEQDGAHYSIVIDADPADYDLVAITGVLRKIVTAEVAWMQDRPFDHYMFIYHFPRGPAGGGMEHAYGTAIDSSADRVKQNAEALADVSAHEFFHLWNVKRIRPQSMEPVDYTREQYTRALWWSEGVTSTVAALILPRAGLGDETSFLRGVAREIGTLQSRPGHKWQSAEESSLDTWFDKYPNYHAVERSISYYNKGCVLGMLLDLAIMDATGGRKGLRDVFHLLNQNYAKRGRFFDDSAGIREAVEEVSGRSFREFFERYVAGTDEIPYDDYFKSVGLKVNVRSTAAADPGFAASRSFDQPLAVTRVDEGGPAAQAGLELGDIVNAVNDRPAGGDTVQRLNGMKPGETVKLKITRRGQPHEISLILGSRSREEYELVDLPQVSPEQRARRTQWIGVVGAAAQIGATGAPASSAARP